MDTSKKSDLLAAGMAIFAMFFGAGNIVFPLALGQHALDKTPWALAGLLLTSVAIPFAGLIAMYLYQGKADHFFHRLGKIPGRALACFSIALLGPLGCAPRCITLAYSTVSLSFPSLSLFFFSTLFCLLLFACVFKPGRLLELIGYFLSPAKIFLLIAVIFVGFWSLPEMTLPTTTEAELPLMFHGLKEGYNTLDLIASIFFAPLILSSLSKGSPESRGPFFIKACSIGGTLLGAVYVGFSFLAYYYAPLLQGTSPDKLLGAIAILVLGKWGGLIVSLTVAITCFTTTVALIAAFSNYIQKEILQEKVGYIPMAAGTLLVTFLIANLGFEGIANFLTPVLKLCYPVLIGLTAYNLICPLFTKKAAVPHGLDA
jgi:LIVCS family branched-chain amino acid:cation transporter